MTRVVFITQQFDPDHPLLATTIPQVAALARHVDEVVVIADRVVESALPANARARSFHSPSRLGRGLRLIAALARELPGLRRDGGAVVAHMCSVYALIAAPIVRGARLPLVLWWVHWKLDLVARSAERVCTAVCTVDPRSFPMSSSKLSALGQGIDIASFPPLARPERQPGLPLRVLVAGRYSPAKGIRTIVRAAGLARESEIALRVEIVGPASTSEEQREREELRRLVGELGLEATVSLGGPLTREEVRGRLGEADLVVNNARGGADRIAYEGAASGLPVVASNPVYSNLLDPELFFGHDDPAGLAARFAEISSLSAAARDAIGERLRQRVAERHSVETWSLGLLRAAGLRPQSPPLPGSRAD